MFIYLGMADAFVYMRYNNDSPFADASERANYRLRIQAHKIEKGLSLPRPKMMFGSIALQSIVDIIRGGNVKSPAAFGMALGVVKEYEEVHSCDLGMLPLMRAKYVDGSEYFVGGTKSADFLRINAEEAKRFLCSRNSVRRFSCECVAAEVVGSIIEVAKYAPSQCNRQSVRVRNIQDFELIQRVLALQGGATGFNEDVHNLFVVSSDLAAWQGPQQRNQAFVDGGLFSSSLLYALHAHGIAACPLNLAVPRRHELEIKRLCGIPKSHRLIMLIAYGWPASPVVKVAASARVDNNELLL